VPPGQFLPGDLFGHPASIERYRFAETVAGRPSRFAGCRKERADGYHQILEFEEKLPAQSVGIVSRLTPEDRKGTCMTPEGCIDHRLERAPFDGGA